MIEASSSYAQSAFVATVKIGASIDLEGRQCVPRVRGVEHLGAGFNWVQLIGRSLSVLLELGALAVVSWLYSYWQDEPTARVDVLVPSFFPIVFGVLADTYEIVSILFFIRKRAINAVATFFDIALIGAGIFAFLVLGMVDRGVGERRKHWAMDMKNAMYFMIAYCIVHAGFIVLAASGMVKIYLVTNRSQRDSQVEKSQVKMVEFSEGQDQPPSQPRLA
ncbi:uncharacterized protein C8A04DRAFT_11086 [Dichotomopilus funicola]|uniref:Uncharacterized protein n=1 Tax=Dichotomopilus funicola TaxID=1934379 RepID=A0AAN6ZNC9_9PEZI|nr:hypothetical protein C8A04DRAFT_11086 [Dichotomopilus funicola]